MLEARDEWDEWEKGRSEEKVYVICWRWGRDKVEDTADVSYRAEDETRGLDLEE